ncbi:hypothetical protein K505DRAFT_266518 [Melanomma pulvis-pyrius CBS 109.77]|uniref:Sensitive to high expression protein 9, mitochondrial n=1 Tax=Melanomma pulvis-pyrius CBS 109.77 TaxID=1314802 RepID=A0A6A6XRF2_9PLEO|nr:hypothetical protein K505DRAFT_266518 [Melanomma pulvis-pyrius CBS 109.77]
MKPLLQRASRSIVANVAFGALPQTSITHSRSFVRPALNAPSICLRCQYRVTSISQPGPLALLSSSISSARPMRRQFSSSRISFDKEKPSEPSSSSPETSPLLRRPDSPPIKRAIPPRVEDTIARVPAEYLPSHRDGQRWNLSKRLSELMDDLLPKLAIVTQKVNTYTGTDYSGIEALRREIKDQEKLVKARRLAIEDAKQILDSAHAQQGSSQKEVVALLERKHSWSATDLERYMSLIRSEHVNDQAVREAKEAVQNAETALEDARSHLEKRERAQYHEEQIWSDTIRRNSTWVTFGLMGLNIFLLLASLVAIEPWRRSRMVKEIKRALDAQKTAFGSAATESTPVAQPVLPIEAAIDAVIEPTGMSLEDLESTRSTLSLPPAVEAAKATYPVQDFNLDTTAEPTSPGATPLTPEQVNPQEAINIEDEVKASTKPGTWEGKITAAALDLISERRISVRKIDFTAAVLQAAATGAVISGALIVLLRSS